MTDLHKTVPFAKIHAVKTHRMANLDQPIGSE